MPIAPRRAPAESCGNRIARWPNLFARGVPFAVVENPFVLAATRSLIRPADVPPLEAIRSLTYFSPVIDEVLASSAGEDYYQHLRHRLARLSR